MFGKKRRLTYKFRHYVSCLILKSIGPDGKKQIRYKFSKWENITLKFEIQEFTNLCFEVFLIYAMKFNV